MINSCEGSTARPEFSRVLSAQLRVESGIFDSRRGTNLSYFDLKQPILRNLYYKSSVILLAL